MSWELLLFWVFGGCTAASALVVIAARNAIGSAMALVATFFFLAGIYVLLSAHTIAVLQVLVYAGAVMVLFLFVIMLLSLPEAGARRVSLSRIWGGLASAGLFAALGWMLYTATRGFAPMPAQAGPSFGTLKTLGALVYGTYVFPFEAVSLLLLVAIVGAVVVAKARI